MMGFGALKRAAFNRCPAFHLPFSRSFSGHNMEKQSRSVGAEDDNGLLCIGEDLLHNILARLPARAFGSAACVCCSWTRLCNRILSRPKLRSALSLNPVLTVAIDEAFEELLSEPIRPHFVIACLGQSFRLKGTHEFLKARLGAVIPIITYFGSGIIGNDVTSNELKEMKWNSSDSDEYTYNTSPCIDHGILLIAGFFPGLKVGAIPLFRSQGESLVDSFLADIKSFTTAASDSNSPMGILMFSDYNYAMRDVLEKMDCALDGETVIAGCLARKCERECFLFSNGDSIRATGDRSQELCVPSTPSVGLRWGRKRNRDVILGAVALVFVKDRNKSSGTGEIGFHLSISTALSPIGPTYKAAAVRHTKQRTSECLTWLTARREGIPLELGGQSILNGLENEVGNGNWDGDTYIGVQRRRKHTLQSGKGKLISSYAFLEFAGVDEEYLFLNGEGIRTGDSFRFYIPDVETAYTTHNNVFTELKALKPYGSQSGVPDSNSQKAAIFGCLIFSCCGRGDTFYESPDVDSTAFLENFPGVPLAGLYCMGEIAVPMRERKENKDVATIGSYLNVYSTVYLALSYTPDPPKS